MLPVGTVSPPTEPTLASLLKIKRLQMLRSPENLVDTLLVCLEMQRLQIARIAKLESEVKALRRR